MPNSTPDTAVYRPLRAGDFADAMSLYRELGNGITVSADCAETRFGEVLSHPGTTIWGAELGGQVVSMATAHVLPNMTYNGRPYCLVENVVTLASHREQGFARGTLNALAQSVWDAGGYKIMLLTGRGRGAEGFYASIGFDAGEKQGMIIRHP